MLLEISLIPVLEKASAHAEDLSAMIDSGGIKVIQVNGIYLKANRQVY
ncbi:MAG: hypothetical protein MZW92_44090 [Comamonadaceae bacterium]|nr:hypothetical protein [Comamonadaceae bacterium]